MHQDEEDWKAVYRMKIERCFPSALRRQCFEGFQIGNYKGDMILNRKGEWGNNVPPRLVVEDERESGRAGITTGTENGRKKRQVNVPPEVDPDDAGTNREPERKRMKGSQTDKPEPPK